MEHITKHESEKFSKAVNNPFSPEMSGYGEIVEGKLVSSYDPTHPLYQFHHESHGYFSGLVGDPDFACLAAKSAVKTSQYAFCAYDDMTAPTVSERPLSRSATV